MPNGSLPANEIPSQPPISHGTDDRPIVPQFTRSYLMLMIFAGGATAIMKLRRWNDWTVGDWLINYSGGFVRRGLPGEVFLLLGRAFHLPAALFVVIFELGCLGVVFYAIYLLLSNSGLHFWVLALLLSPAGFFLQVVDPIASFHKELLLFASLSALVLLLERGAGGSTLVLYLTCVTSVCVLSHEGLIFYLPYLGVALVVRYRNVRASLRMLAIPAIVAAALAALVSRFPGDQTVAARICASVGYRSDAIQDGCPDSITYLRYSADYASSVVLSSIQTGHYLRFFSIVGVLAVLPILLALRTLYPSASARIGLSALGWGVATCATGSIILFVYGTDWDRWIHIHIVCITLLLLYIDFRSPARPELPGAFRAPSRIVLSVALLLYCTCWTLAPFDTKLPLWGVAHFVKMYVNTSFHPLPLPPR